MAFVRTKWSQFLEPNSELPTDVVFIVEERHQEEHQEGVTGHQEEPDEKKVKRVPAHMFLLAGASPVFRRQFFGAAKENRAEVVIKDTTIEAFTTMIKFLYVDPHPKQFSLEDIDCPQRLCEMVNISERYQIPDLLEMAKAALENLPVTEENLIFTATTAKNYSVFEEVSKMLTAKCQAFLSLKLKTAEDVFSMIVKTKESFPGADMNVLCDLLKKTTGSEEDTIFHNVAYLGSMVVQDPKDEAAIQQHMAGMNQESQNPLLVTVSVPQNSLGSVVLRESATKTHLKSFRIPKIIFFASGGANPEENSCFAFTSEERNVVQCHVFRCEVPEAVNRIFVSFAKAYKRPEALG